ncbi:MAG: fumarylacetoacetate hydrolase family protein [Gammaproteobacteria bacterium]|nr:fumarylacetoacetate hydrolase family protein [Gammaproteobacteria bacterium]MDH5305429.1 fumarylacetoacetate hydrolase family protein [Gammaproteobacteria bacterium]MDH5323612.1 fumarylacetoacetate hydrolase family protein [Gammaproteobacteria bacterium]
MRLITFSLHGIEQVGVRHGDRIIPVASVAPQLPGSIVEILASGGLATLAAIMASCTDTGLAPAEVEYRPLIPRPGKIICIGRNYAAHAAERGADTPTFPEIFFRGATSLVAHNAPIIRPQCSDKLDFEGEIAFVIGKSCRHASNDNALDYIAGYSLFNDATLRDYQRFSTQWTIGKNFDGTGAFGPELVTADELPVGIAGMTLTTKLNGEQMQHGRTDDLVFPVRRLVTILSECMTLEPGDVVVTGTPSGVGSARQPPLWMKAGDTIEVEVAGIGKLCNVVRDEA